MFFILSSSNVLIKTLTILTKNLYFLEGCGWCGKAVDENTGLSSAAATFCSELCFSQSRRANFKKNKTCDWCRHVRHTVSYVDSQVRIFFIKEKYKFGVPGRFIATAVLLRQVFKPIQNAYFLEGNTRPSGDSSSCSWRRVLQWDSNHSRFVDE